MNPTGSFRKVHVLYVTHWSDGMGYTPFLAILSTCLAQSRKIRCFNKTNIYTFQIKDNVRSIPKLGEEDWNSHLLKPHPSQDPSSIIPSISQDIAVEGSAHLLLHAILLIPLQWVRSVTFFLKLRISAHLWVMWVTQGPHVGSGDEASWSSLWLHFHTRVRCKQMDPLTRGLVEIAHHSVMNKSTAWSQDSLCSNPGSP